MYLEMGVYSMGWNMGHRFSDATSCHIDNDYFRIKIMQVASILSDLTLLRACVCTQLLLAEYRNDCFSTGAFSSSSPRQRPHTSFPFV